MATSGQIILHLDLDCFYCQVEQKRLGIPRHVPAAVQQWGGLIAINYAARGLGVTRHMPVMQAMHHCPELKCIHVQTLGGETGQDGVAGPVNSGLTHPNDRLLQKACLERYRRASAEIIALIRSIVPQAPLEKASIDEVYVDVTSLVEKELAERDDAATEEHAEMDAFAWGSVVEGGPLQPENEYDRRLSVGASIACRLRGAIRDQLDFTVSAGIAHTKLVAKIGSARNKPDNQTIITSRGIASLMESLPLGKLRNFGGKLGAELQALGCTTAGQVAALPFKQLQQHFGERAKFISDCVRGLYSEPVTVRELSKSMLAAKSFVANSDMAALERWLRILADELADRMIYDAQINQRYPRNLVLSYRQQNSPAGRRTSCPMPKAPAPGPTAEMLTQAALGLLQKCSDALPCCNLGLTATDFVDAPGDEQGCITHFFQSTASKASNNNSERPGQAAPSGASKPNTTHAKAKPSKPTIERMFKKASAQQEQAGSRPADQKVRQVENADESRRHSELPNESIAAQDGLARATDQSSSSLDEGDAEKVQAEGCEGMAEDRNSMSDDEIRPGGVEQQRPGNVASNAHTNGSGLENSKKRSSDREAQSLSQPEASGRADDTGQGRQEMLAEEKEGLDGIDLEEQKRILREIWLRKNMSSSPKQSQKRPNSQAMKDRTNGLKDKSHAKQPRLTDMFGAKKS